jgi:hypothetical protein
MCAEISLGMELCLRCIIHFIKNHLKSVIVWLIPINHKLNLMNCTSVKIESEIEPEKLEPIVMALRNKRLLPVLHQNKCEEGCGIVTYNE